MSEKIINLDIKDNYRIIVISDIHGHHEVFSELLEKVKLKEKDYLIILGDFLNKGNDSFETLKKLKKLGKRKKTFILKGNHEYWIEYMAESLDGFTEYEKYITEYYHETIFHGMLESQDLTHESFDSSDDLYKFFTENHSEDFDFLSKLPIIVKNDDFIFVHGGYEDEFDIDNDEFSFLKYDNYGGIAKGTNKIVVVGHWPACQFREDRILNEPYFNHDNKTISIDGGIGVKPNGELNAFIIEKKNGVINYDCINHNYFKTGKIIKKHIFEKEETIFVNYPHYDFDIISRCEKYSRCLHTYSNKKFTVFNSLIDEKDGKYELKTNYVNNFLNLKIGDNIEIVEIYSDCAYVRFNGEFGWVLSEQVEMIK